MAGTPRHRSRSSVKDYGSWHIHGDYFYPTDSYGTSTMIEYQTVDDHVGNGWVAKPPPIWDAGGPFLMERFETMHRPFYGSTKGSQGRSFTGVLLPVDARRDGTQPADQLSSSAWNKGHVGITSDADLDALGTTAISRVAPTNPHASAYTMLGELRRDGLPAITGVDAFRKRGAPSSIGGEYLNYEFGIKPLLSDITKLRDAMVNSRKIIDQYRRDAGRLVRRRYDFPSEVTSTTGLWSNTSQGLDPVLDAYFWRSTAGRTEITTRTVKKVWFSGAFTYRLPDLDGPIGSAARTIAEANHLLGIIPTPQGLWNLVPWTWAADWYTNIGDVVNNVSMYLTDGLLLRYGYVMEQTVTTTDLVHSGSVLNDGSAVHSQARFVYTRKVRRRATPFGFGLKDEEFTPRQWAIIAALGLSQGGRYVAK